MDAEWIIGAVASHWRLGLAILAGVPLLGFLWWVLADFALATFDLTEWIERSGWRDGRNGGDADTPASA